jgi:D-inositol-3-phosphate glycosyltransferase
VHTSPLDQPGAGDGGGLNVYVREVARRMAARGVRVDVFTRRTDPASRPVELAPGAFAASPRRRPGRAVAKEDLTHAAVSFRAGARGASAPRGIEVLHAHYWLSGWVGRRIARRTGIPLVQTFHTLAALKNATLAPGDRPEGPLRLVAEAEVARDADQVLVLTCGEARLFHTSFGLSGAKLTVVPAGVDLDLFRPDPPLAPSPRMRSRSGPGRRAAGDARRAASSCSSPAGSSRSRDLTSRCAPRRGPPPPRRRAAAHRRRRVGCGRVATSARTSCSRWPGSSVSRARHVEPALPQAELADRLRRADVVLVPSRSETFGLIALEAQACGTPVVAARVPGLEVVVGGGGTLVDGHDPVDHARAVLAYLDDPELRGTPAHGRARGRGRLVVGAHRRPSARRVRRGPSRAPDERRAADRPPSRRGSRRSRTGPLRPAEDGRA